MRNTYNGPTLYVEWNSCTWASQCRHKQATGVRKEWSRAQYVSRPVRGMMDSVSSADRYNGAQTSTKACALTPKTYTFPIRNVIIVISLLQPAHQFCVLVMWEYLSMSYTECVNRWACGGDFQIDKECPHEREREREWKGSRKKIHVWLCVSVCVCVYACVNVCLCMCECEFGEHTRKVFFPIIIMRTVWHRKPHVAMPCSSIGVDTFTCMLNAQSECISECHVAEKGGWCVSDRIETS